MLRPFIRSLATRVHRVRDRWYARPFAQWLGDARLWSLQRRGITLAFGAGLAICFVPLPVHVPAALAVAVLARVNVPVILSTVFLVNPLTVVPVYYLAYRVGCLALGAPQDAFSFSLSLGLAAARARARCGSRSSPDARSARSPRACWAGSCSSCCGAGR